MVSPEVQKWLDRAVLCGKQAEEHRRQAIVHRDGYLQNAKWAGDALVAAKEQAVKESEQKRDVVGPLHDEFCKQAGVEKSCAYNYINVAKYWDYLQSFDPLPDSITQCLALLKLAKRKKGDRARNWHVWNAHRKLKQRLHELWTSEASPQELAERTQLLREDYEARIAKYKVPVRATGTGCMADSGAYSLNKLADAFAKDETDEAKKKLKKMAYYDTPDFFAFMDRYATWVQRQQDKLVTYANLDVIGDAERTWRNQRYLETYHQLKPMPVVHFRSDLKWIRHYMELGYELIGFGGLKGNLGKKDCQAWLTEAFNVVCDTPDRLPKVKIHAFGVSGIATLRKFPWYSADFTTWNVLAALGQIAVPQWEDGKFLFDRPYTAVQVSKGKPNQKLKDEDNQDDQKIHPKAYERLNAEDQVRVDEWLDFIDVFYGKEEKPRVYGVSTSHFERREANLKFYEHVLASLPPYPQPFPLNL